MNRADDGAATDQVLHSLELFTLEVPGRRAYRTQLATRECPVLFTFQHTCSKNNNNAVKLDHEAELSMNVLIYLICSKVSVFFFSGKC